MLLPKMSSATRGWSSFREQLRPTVKGQ